MRLVPFFLRRHHGLPALGEELAQQPRGLDGHDPGAHLGPVVEGRVVHDVEDGARGSRLGVVGSVDQPLDPGQDDRAGAHGAGLQGDVESGLGQPPAADDGGGVAKHEHLGVGGGVVAPLALVAAGGDHLTPDDKHGADGHLALLGRTPGLFEGKRHQPPVLRKRSRR